MKYLPLLFISILCFPNSVISKTTLTLATGGKEGTYYALGQGIKEVIEKENPDIEVIVFATEGSIENAKLIDAGSVHLTLIQNDIAYYFSKGERIFKFPSDKARGLASLYTEPIQIVARKELRLESIQDLKGKRVAVGPKNSGTEFNSAVILGAYEVDYSDIETHYLSFTEAKDSLLSHKVDVIFITAGLPTPALSEIASEITFISIEPDIIRLIRETYPYFVATSIPSNTYSGQVQEISTIGVRALFVARKDINPTLAKKLTGAIFEERETLRRSHPIASFIELKSSRVGMTIPLHPGAEEYYIGKELLKKSSLKRYYPILIVILSALIISVIMRYFQCAILRIFRRRVWVRLGVSLLFSYLILTFAIFLVERSVNESFSSFLESIWSTIVYLLSGLENRGPITNSGRVISAFIFLVGVVFLGSIAGEFASFFIKNREVRMPKDLINQIVICNWNDGGDKVIKEIHSPVAEPEVEIVVLTDKTINEDELRERKEYERVFFVRGDPTLHSVLKASRVHLARSVVILIDNEESDPDAKTALIALAITKGLCKDSSRPPIIAEVANHRKIQHLRNAGVDEYICATDYGLGIIAQCALTGKLSQAYQQLLSYSKDTNELYIIEYDKLPRTSEGKSIIDGLSFREASDLFNKNRDPENPVILVGMRRGEKVILNPKDNNKGSKEEKPGRFQEGDALIVMAFQMPDLSKLKQ